jgi:hypothetical protein
MGCVEENKIVLGLSDKYLWVGSKLALDFKRNLDFSLSFPVYKDENTAVGIRHADLVAPSIRKSWY